MGDVKKKLGDRDASRGIAKHLSAMSIVENLDTGNRPQNSMGFNLTSLELENESWRHLLGSEVNELTGMISILNSAISPGIVGSENSGTLSVNMFNSAMSPGCIMIGDSDFPTSETDLKTVADIGELFGSEDLS